MKRLLLSCDERKDGYLRADSYASLVVEVQMRQGNVVRVEGADASQRTDSINVRKKT